MSLTTAEAFAASNVLTDWPDHFTYDELLTAVENQHPDVLVWERYEDELPSIVVDSIEGLRAEFIGSVIRMTNDLREAIKQGDPMTIAEQLANLENQLGA